MVEAEKQVHDAFRLVAMNLWSKYRVRVEEVRFDWYDISSAGNIDMEIVRLEMRSSLFSGVTK